MADKNWQQIRKIFDDALRRKPEERSKFVNEVCGDNKTLLRDVESLLSALDGADSFLETPVVTKVVEVIEPETKRLECGTCFAHYEIIEQIGAGGMGEVYLARDKKLDRKVAVKVLSEQFARHESNLQRFTGEAKAASALNHPNILVIHEIGESDGAHYIVSEYIEGKTLREIIRETKMKLSKILDISIQISGALSAAHKVHLVHRDIKPENIMIREDGFIKVLDFGLAKLVQEKNKTLIGLDALTLQQNETAKGIILGTVNYMSPEQAKGERVDERTDIFSLGILIYEMLIGRTPFAADSVSETIANLLNTEPRPFSYFATDVPAELQHIVLKMLRKDKEQRYQTMKELAADLGEFQENLKLKEKLELPASLNGKVTEVLQVTTDGELSKKINKFTNNIASSTKEISRISEKHKIRTSVVFLVVAFLAIIGITWFFNKNTIQFDGSSNVTVVDKPKLYSQMKEPELLDFIQQRSRHIQTLIGDEPSDLDQEALWEIKAKIDYYIQKKDNLSQKPFEEGLRVIYGRASQYAPLVIRSYEEKGVPPTLGLYQAMIESEYHDCLINPTGPIGLFQFLPKTAEKYGLKPKDYCDVEKQSVAAAGFISDLISDFGEEKSSWTLALLSFNQGEDGTRKQLRHLRSRGIKERNFWAIFRYKNDIQPSLPDDAKQYVPSFFAAAIIGETPEAFELSTPPLTTLREEDK